MCLGIIHTHSQCQHDRKYEVIEYCEKFVDGNCALVPIHFKQITAPSLCISCFRKEEAKIDDLYHDNVKMIRIKIVEYEAVQTDRRIRGRAQGSVDPNIAQLEQSLVEARRWRDWQIHSFRFEQNVWGDG